MADAEAGSRQNQTVPEELSVVSEVALTDLLEVARSSRAVPLMVMAASVIAEQTLEAGDAETALMQIEPVLDEVRAAPAWPWAGEAVRLAVRALCEMGALDLARELVTSLLRGIEDHSAQIAQACLLDCQAVILTGLGREGPASDALAASQAAWRSLGRAHDAAVAQLRWSGVASSMMAAAHVEHSRQEALTLLAEAGPESRRARLTGLLRSYRRHPPSRISIGLTSRERQIARLIDDRRTNREIAVALGLSVRTVECHVGQIRSKRAREAARRRDPPPTG